MLHLLPGAGRLADRADRASHSPGTLTEGNVSRTALRKCHGALCGAEGTTRCGDEREGGLPGYGTTVLENGCDASETRRKLLFLDLMEIGLDCP